MRRTASVHLSQGLRFEGKLVWFEFDFEHQYKTRIIVTGELVFFETDAGNRRGEMMTLECYQIKSRQHLAISHRYHRLSSEPLLRPASSGSLELV